MLRPPPPNCACFSLRRLSPYRGTLQVVDIGAARAISEDGESWEVQVFAERPSDLWASPGTSRFAFRFGSWHRRRGLERVPVNPILNNAEIIPAAERLLPLLSDLSASVPFAPRDDLELWLMDAGANRPLALLASAVSTHAIPALSGRKQWLPPGEDRDGVPLAPQLLCRAAHLAGQVVECAGETPRTQWLRRTPDLGGVALEPTHPATPGISLPSFPADAFPELLCRMLELEGRHDEPASEEYLAALAPRLLMLHHLTDRARSRLEHLAVRRAAEVAACWRLYPKVLDRRLLEQALVEARLRASNAAC